MEAGPPLAVPLPLVCADTHTHKEREREREREREEIACCNNLFCTDSKGGLQGSHLRAINDDPTWRQNKRWLELVVCDLRSSIKSFACLRFR